MGLDVFVGIASGSAAEASAGALATMGGGLFARALSSAVEPVAWRAAYCR